MTRRLLGRRPAGSSVALPFLAAAAGAGAVYAIERLADLLTRTEEAMAE